MLLLYHLHLLLDVVSGHFQSLLELIFLYFFLIIGLLPPGGYGKLEGIGLSKTWRQLPLPSKDKKKADVTGRFTNFFLLGNSNVSRGDGLVWDNQRQI